MKAVGYRKSLPIDAADALTDFETAKPEPKGRDIRVAVKAISANPVDYKVRKRAAPPEGETKILGYDAAGIVDAVGPDAIGQRGVAHPGDAERPVGVAQQAPGPLVGPGHVRVAEDLEALVVVVREQRKEEERLAVTAKVR